MTSGEPAGTGPRGTPAHDWLRPRVVALLAGAERAGFSRPVALAAMIDILTLVPALVPADVSGAPEGIVASGTTTQEPPR